ncbi:MAG: hypothetical protein IPH93_00765 [Saprospiraceae bacterium]|nr:hypothetical protein [Saprospiraceae bacterium]MBK7810042.1 hypothetical protein [Saprospiraceae bacterium]MBK9629643.1 hypothetical protein [Saprospiraceae bacterium]
MKSHLLFSIQLIALWAITGTFSFQKLENGSNTVIDNTSTIGKSVENINPIKLPIKSTNQEPQTEPLSFATDTDLIFQICYHQCGDPRLAINQECFRSCWLRLYKRNP